MTSYAKNCKATIIPGIRYRNALEIIEWLGRAFGFEQQAVYMGADQKVMHAELTFGNGMIMIGSVDNGTPASALLKQPAEVSGAEKQTPYLIVSDCKALYAQAKAAGAEIITELEEKDYGGEAFTCRDPEGHNWHFGSYDPWEVAQRQ